MFLKFLTRRRGDPLHVSMMGVRMGERLLQIGCDDGTLLAGVAAKVGLSGGAAAVVTGEDEAARAARAGEEAGALIDLHQTAAGAMPFSAGAFDLVIVDDTAGRFAGWPADAQLGALREGLRVLRAGGRIAIVEAVGTGGLRSRPISRPEGYAADARLAEAGFRPVRLLAEREIYRFYEALRP